MIDVLSQQYRNWSYHRGSKEPAQARVADFLHGGTRIVAFLEANDTSSSNTVNLWPQIAEIYAKEQGFDPNNTRWYEVHPRRFANGRPSVSEYLFDRQTWKFETNLFLARDITERLGFNPDTLPLDI